MTYWLTLIVVLWLTVVGSHLAGRWYNQSHFFEELEPRANWAVLHLPGETYYIHFIVTDGWSYSAWGVQ
jgi:hypothetical protein